MGFFPGSIYFQETDHGSVLKGPENVTLLWSFINPFQIAVFIVIFAAYPTYTLIYPIVCRKYHKDYFKNIAVEYEYVTKILWISIPLVVIFSLIPLIASVASGYDLAPLFNSIVESLKQSPDVVSGLSYTSDYLVLVVSTGFLKIALSLVRTEFRLEFAKGCLEIVSEENNEFKKMKYLMKGLNSYNKFIRKQLKMNINLSAIYFKIINSPTKERDELIQKICKVFDGDELEVVNNLSKLLEREDKEIVSTTETLKNTLQQLSTSLEWIISAIVGLTGAVISVLTFSH